VISDICTRDIDTSVVPGYGSSMGLWGIL